MAANVCQNVEFQPANISSINELKQTRSVFFLDEDAGESDFIEKPSTFKHVTHISWNEEKGLEISTNDKDFAELFMKVGETAASQNEKDIRQVVFDCVSNLTHNDNDDVTQTHKTDSTVDETADYDIGHPYNFQHVTHCSFTKNEGFNVVTQDKKLSWFYNKSKCKKEEED